MFKSRSVIAAVLAMLIFASSSLTTFGWGPITHYHINKDASSGLEMAYPSVWYQNGTGPDMFINIVGASPLADPTHSPIPKVIVKSDGTIIDWRWEPNLAYLMLKVRGRWHPESRYYASAMGWGGHIVADWVAHNKEGDNDG